MIKPLNAQMAECVDAIATATLSTIGARLILAAAPALAVCSEARAYCVEPSEPYLPVPETAEQYEMKTAEAGMKAYLAAMKAYLSCLELEVTLAQGKQSNTVSRWEAAKMIFRSR